MSIFKTTSPLRTFGSSSLLFIFLRASCSSALYIFSSLLRTSLSNEPVKMQKCKNAVHNEIVLMDLLSLFYYKYFVREGNDDCVIKLSQQHLYNNHSSRARLRNIFNLLTLVVLQIIVISFRYFHTRPYLGNSAQLKIQQVSACKIGPRSGIII